MPRTRLSIVLASLATLAACAPDAPTAARPVDLARAFGGADAFSAWSPAVRLESAGAPADASFNTTALEGCPLQSRDGRVFFMASNRPGGKGGIDIWIATRESVDDPWGAPVNAGDSINTAANEFCPTLARDGHTFYFVSNRAGGLGGDDVYVTRLHGSFVRFDGEAELAESGDPYFETPVNVGAPINSAGNEASPFPLEQPGSGPVLYFSSTRAGGYSTTNDGPVTGDADLYMAEWQGGTWATAALVPGVNSAANDGQPNVRRDALELYFYSNRPGTIGGNDIWVATRAKARDSWSAPANLGPAVNSTADETRPSLSWDATLLYFGSNRAGGEGSSDIYVSTRHRLGGDR